MRVAIFHDFIPFVGGGERLVLTLARAWGATVYTAEVDRASVRRLGFDDVPIVSLGPLFQRPPFKQAHASLRFAAARVDADAFVLSGHWSIFAARRHHPNVLYCYTPARDLYDLRVPLLRRQRDPLRRAFTWAWVTGRAAADRIAWTQVDRVVAVSGHIRERIRTHLRRDARVVYPPTDVSRYRFEEVGDFWLSVNRLYPEKGLELQFDTFRRLPHERLVVVGGYAREREAAGYVKQLRPPPNVELRGEVDEAELVRLYARCRGLVCTARDEDFGMTPVEAMASGKIVVAVDHGGYRETVVPGATGFLLPANPASFAHAIASLATKDLAASVDACRRRAQDFDAAHFLAGMRDVLEEAVA